MKITPRSDKVVKGAPAVGNVYLAGGGRRGSTHYWVVIGMTETGSTLYMLGFTKAGDVSSTASYNAHSFEDRRIVGQVDWDTMPAMEVEWF